MAKHTQTDCLSVFDHFMGLALKGLNGIFRKKYKNCFRSVSCYSNAIHYIFVKSSNIIAKPFQQTKQ